MEGGQEELGEGGHAGNWLTTQEWRGSQVAIAASGGS